METKKPETVDECLAATLDQDGVDVSLWTGLDMQRFKQYCMLRNELSQKYPKPESEREETDDTLNMQEAHQDSKASLFTRLLMTVHAMYERIDMLQNFATEYDKKIVRFYSHVTLNWPDQGKEWLKMLEDHGIYEMVESYFKVLRKYGLGTEEEPYYFLSPQQKQKVKFAGDMLKRSTMMDDGEIKLSVLEGLE